MKAETSSFKIEKPVEEIPLIVINQFKQLDLEDEIPGYIAISTATNNVEDDEYKSFPLHLDSSADCSVERAIYLDKTEYCLKDITAKLIKDGIKNPEIIIAVHGFSNNFNSAQNWYKNIHRYINSDSSINHKNIVFIGYRWPSESVVDSLVLTIYNAFEALPILPKNVFLFSLLISLVLLVSLLIFYKKSLLFVFGLTTVITSLIFALIILRLVTYFRDSYRANYFGTPDLVELVRQLDRSLFSLDRNTKVKLSFLGHSMGCSVITNAIRILSDVFEPSSIGTLSSYQTEKQPSHKIGRTFQLERLVLVAPDIPVESVIPRRSNFLRSAIRRVKEAHVFTNEGDLALRIASTAANYFSFPAKTRFSGYRLGNLTVKHFKNSKDKSGSSPRYGIVNNLSSSLNLPFNHLEIRSSNSEHRKLEEKPFYPWVAKSPNDVTNRLSYYDCTDYFDCSDFTNGNKGIVSLAVGKPSLNLVDYSKLLFAYVLYTFNPHAGVDTHGGYFHGKISKYLIYRLAFFGFDKLQASLLPKTLHQVCEEKKIQVVISPTLLN